MLLAQFREGFRHRPGATSLESGVSLPDTLYRLTVILSLPLERFG